jgi:cell wall-associated NlpC family hydrolase
MKTRAEAVQIARSFLGTPYVLGGRLKSAGVDCATLLGCYLIEIGAAPPDLWKNLETYHHDWFLHSANERYLRALVKFGFDAAQGLCRSDSTAQPGDIVLFRVVNSKIFNHGAIVTSWPRGIHAAATGVREVNLVTTQLTGFRPMEVFDPFAKMEPES